MTTLHPYQEEGLEWVLRRPKSALHWEMGLGKTLTAATALRLLLGSLESERALVVGPIMVANGVWPAELAKWFPGEFRPALLHQAMNRYKNQVAHARRDRNSGAVRQLARDVRVRLGQLGPIQVVNYENLPFLVKVFKNVAWPYDLLILDEADRVKNPEAQRTRAAIWMAERSRRVIELTGTPSPRTSEDLWSQIYALDGGAALGRTQGVFRERWYMPHPAGHGWLPRPLPGEAPEDAKRRVAVEVGNAIAHLVMSLKTSDYLQLPDRIDNFIPVALPEKARDAYRRLERDALLELETGVVDAANAGVLQGKLAQAASGAMYLEDGRRYEVLHDAKLDALDSVLAEAGGEPVLVCYGFRSELERLRARYPRAEVLTRDNVAEVSARWNAGQIPLLLSYPRDGLNLQVGGHIMVWLSQPWDYRLYAQMCARLHRQGQVKPVFIHHLVAADTVDEDAVEARAGKAAVQELLMERTKLRAAA